MAESSPLSLLATLAIALILPACIINVNPSHNQTILTPQVADTPLAPVTGSQLTIIILVQFPDETNSTSTSHIATLLSGMNNYYAEDSYGLVSFTTTIKPATTSWYSMPHTIKYYSQDSPAADTHLVSDALQTAYNAGVNLHSYKYAMVVHAGADEAMTHASTDIHSFTIPGYTFTPTPLNSFEISTSVVSESDPLGVFCHEAGHLLGLPDLYDLTQQTDPVNNFIGYWDIMALGEWNPNNGNPLQPSPGTYPSQHSSWSKIKLGWISNSSVLWVYPGNITTVTIHDLEQSAVGIRAVKIPIAVNSDGSLSYYLVEARTKIGQYDQYLPFPSDYPGEALLIYKVNDSITAGRGNLKLVDAHPGGDLSDAGFGPCFSPCVSNNTFSDPSSFVKIIVTHTDSTCYTIVVDRTSSPLLLLQVDTPSPGMTIFVDGANSKSDRSNELRLPVHQGPHEIQVETQVPVSLGSTSIQLGLSDTFAAWSDGNTANPRWVSVVKDTVFAATYRVVVEPTFATATTATLILAAITMGIVINQKGKDEGASREPENVKSPESKVIPAKYAGLFPRNNRLSGNPVNCDEEPKTTQN